MMNENLYHDIININVTKTIYDKIVKICKFKNFSAFMIIYVKFDIFKIINSVIINEYDIKFRNIINEFVIYSFNFKMNENWLIYKYFENLDESNNVRFFIERWIFEHEFFDNENNIDFKFDLFDVIHVYEIQCVNFLTNANKNVISLITNFAVIETRIEKSIQSNVISKHIKIFTQTIKWCIHCQKFYHIDDECVKLYSYLKIVLKHKRIEIKKRCERKINYRNNNENNNNNNNKNYKKKQN